MKHQHYSIVNTDVLHFCSNAKCCYTNSQYAKGHLESVVMLKVAVLIFIMVGVVVLSVTMLRVLILIIIMLGVVMLEAVMLRVTELF